jgi:hypothetical protein
MSTLEDFVQQYETLMEYLMTDPKARKHHRDMIERVFKKTNDVMWLLHSDREGDQFNDRLGFDREPIDYPDSEER